MGTVFLWTMGGMVMLSQAVTEDLHGGVLDGVLGSVKSGALGYCVMKPLYCALLFDSDKKNQAEKRLYTETILLS